MHKSVDIEDGSVSGGHTSEGEARASPLATRLLNWRELFSCLAVTSAVSCCVRRVRYCNDTTAQSVFVFEFLSCVNCFATKIHNTTYQVQYRTPTMASRRVGAPAGTGSEPVHRYTRWCNSVLVLNHVHIGPDVMLRACRRIITINISKYTRGA